MLVWDTGTQGHRVVDDMKVVGLYWPRHSGFLAVTPVFLDLLSRPHGGAARHLLSLPCHLPPLYSPNSWFAAGWRPCCQLLRTMEAMSRGSPAAVRGFPVKARTAHMGSGTPVCNPDSSLPFLSSKQWQ